MSSQAMLQAFEKSVAIRTPGFGKAIEQGDFAAADTTVRAVIDKAEGLSQAPEISQYAVARDFYDGIQSHLLGLANAVDAEQAEQSSVLWRDFLTYLHEKHQTVEFLADSGGKKPPFVEMQANLQALINMLPFI
ncbi:MAG: hypothetical protein AAFR65_11140 [Pseudomonadota bacterium]